MNTKYIQTIPSSKKYEFTEEGFRLAKALLSENKSYAYISKIFEITPETLSLLCKENKIDKDNRRKYTINENFFKEINTPEQAYWLGFLDADGYVYRNKIILALQKQDESTIKKFLTSIGSNKSIKYKTVLFDGKKECHQAYVSVDSIVMVQDLAKYGCTTKKSLVLAPPTFLSKKSNPVLDIRLYGWRWMCFNIFRYQNESPKIENKFYWNKRSFRVDKAVFSKCC